MCYRCRQRCVIGCRQRCVTVYRRVCVMVCRRVCVIGVGRDVLWCVGGCVLCVLLVVCYMCW